MVKWWRQILIGIALRKKKTVRSAKGDCKIYSPRVLLKKIQGNNGINERNFLDKRYFSNFDANGKDSKREILDNG